MSFSVYAVVSKIKFKRYERRVVLFFSEMAPVRLDELTEGIKYGQESS